ncbi:MAG TPA: GAF domain-containing protein [Thermomicrobiales bacterium]|nr:GAF domain-containing protein [Thermomicrobiales bacterium]
MSSDIQYRDRQAADVMSGLLPNVQTDPQSDGEWTGRLLQSVAQSLGVVLGAQGVASFLYDYEFKRLPAFVHLADEEGAGSVTQPAIDAAMERELIATRRVVLGSAPLAASTNPCRALLLPILADDALIGAIWVWSDREHDAFAPDRVSLAAEMAVVAGNGIQRARLLRRVQTLSGIGGALAATDDIEQICRHACDAVLAALDVDVVYIAFHIPGRDAFDVPVVVSREHGLLPASEISLDSEPIRNVLATGRLLECGAAPESLAERRTRPTGPLRRARSSVLAPLVTDGAVTGVITARSRRDVIAADDVEVFASIAGQASVALSNARRFETLRRRADDVSLLGRASRAANDSLNLDDTCAALERLLRADFACETLIIATRDDEANDRPFVIIHAGASDELDVAPVTNAVLEHAPDVVGGAQPRVITLAGAGVRPVEVALIPMLGGRRSTGVLALAAWGDDHWSTERLEILVTVAAITANAIDAARLHDEAERERRNVSRLTEWQQALIHGGEALTHSGDVERLIDTVSVELERLLPHRSLAVYVMSDEPDRMTTIRVRDRGAPVDVTMTLTIGQGIVGAAVLDSTPLLVNDAHLDSRSHYPPDDPVDTTHGENLIAAPLIVNGGTIGAVAISREGSRPFTDDEFHAFTSFVPHLATIIHTTRLVARNQAVYLSTIRALIATIDAKDPLTRGHSERVSRYARQIASEMNLPSEDQDTIELAALLHDIGKIGVPNEILSKPSALSASERAIMMEHAVLGAEIVSGARRHEIERLVPLIRHHHEWYQGGGYPDGLSGDDIPIGAAIIAVADAFDTMTTNRPYRQAMSVAAALDEARRNATTQFHPLAVDALTSTIETSSLSVDALNGFSPMPSAVTHITPVDVRPVSVLYRIAREIASIGDVDSFLLKTVRIISEELRYPNVSILLPAGDGEHFVVRANVSDVETDVITGRVAPIGDSICGWVFRYGSVANVADVLKDGRYYPAGNERVRSELAAPLTVDATVIGVLNIESPIPHAFTSLDERMLVAIASQIAPAVQLAQVHDDIKRAAQRDGLTGIYNHASFYSRLEELLSDGQRVALFIFDVEGLKRINDTAGHLAGDTALRRVAMTLDLETRPQDTVARYGGDEFAVIVTDVDETTAVEMATRLQAAVNRITWGPGAEEMSISVGVAISGRDGCKATDLVAIADKRMYDARMREREDESAKAGARERRSTPDQ